MASDAASTWRPFRVRFAYSAGNLPGQVISQAFALWLIFFYAPPDDEDAPTFLPILGLPDLDLGLFAFPDELAPRVLLGLTLTIAGIIEAFDDPILGYLTDRTKSRWGRRIPYVVLATPWWAFLFFLLFVPPFGDESIANLLWLIVVLEGFWLAGNVAGAPLEALMPHIAKSHEDRVSVAAMQLVFGILGAFLGLAVSGLLIDWVGFAGMAGILAVVGFVGRYASLAGCWDYARTDDEPSTPGLVRSVRETLSNPHFIAFLPGFIFFRIAQIMITAWIPFYVAAVLGDVEAFGFSGSEDEGVFTSAMTALIIVGIMAGIVIFAPLARRAGKARAFRVSMLWGAATLFLLFFVGFVPGVPKLAQTAAVVLFAAFPMAGVFMLPNILIADIVDHDAERTSTRREGMFYGTQNLLEKSASAFAPLIFALVLLAGDSADDPLGIRLVGPVGGVLLLVGWFSFRRYALYDDVRDAEPSEAAST
ncbi:MAG: MFS transporter [Chloroflexi bacterium]|nr:MFS transporter [Chloroflexota bacterium]